jgi:hypothetical protein
MDYVNKDTSVLNKNLAPSAPVLAENAHLILQIFGHTNLAWMFLYARIV